MNDKEYTNLRTDAFDRAQSILQSQVSYDKKGKPDRVITTEDVIEEANKILKYINAK